MLPRSDPKATQTAGCATAAGLRAVPLFYAREQWIAYSNKLAHPNYIPLFGVTIDNWWQKEP